jgi:hypothetical protein
MSAAGLGPTLRFSARISAREALTPFIFQLPANKARISSSSNTGSLRQRERRARENARQMERAR